MLEFAAERLIKEVDLGVGVLCLDSSISGNNAEVGTGSEPAPPLLIPTKKRSEESGCVLEELLRVGV